MAARDEADRLATRLSHRSAGFEGLESELASSRAALAVARAESTEREGMLARMEAEAERSGQGGAHFCKCIRPSIVIRVDLVGDGVHETSRVFAFIGGGGCMSRVSSI